MVQMRQSNKCGSVRNDEKFNVHFGSGVVRVLLKPSFLRQHQTDLEQCPLAPTSTAKSSTDHPLDSIVAFKAKYLLILVRYHDSMFSSQGHVNSMSITFLKTLEKIAISGLS